MILHWNGKAWKRVASPNPGSNDVLTGVTAISATDVWAVGTYSGGALLLHWNGRSWTQVKSTIPNVLQLSGVAATAANNVWAAGYNDRNQSMILHWNGAAWSLVKTPDPGKIDMLSGVSAWSATSAWAVGTYCVSGCLTRSEVDHGLVLHWNGKAWSEVTTRITSEEYDAVAAVSRTDVWAGGYAPIGKGLFGPLLVHWTGTTWSKVRDTTGGAALGFSSAANGWAVEGSEIAHWTGTGWRVTGSPAPLMSVLLGVSTDRKADAWAVGYWCKAKCASAAPVQYTLAMHWNGHKWTRT